MSIQDSYNTAFSDLQLCVTGANSLLARARTAKASFAAAKAADQTLSSIDRLQRLPGALSGLDPELDRCIALAVDLHKALGDLYLRQDRVNAVLSTPTADPQSAARLSTKVRRYQSTARGGLG